jgi:hypothetical protein
MKEAYRSGDPYLAFAMQAGAVPPTATKKTHEAEREQFKACVLAVQYGMGEASLAARISQPVARARQLLALHRQTYRQFWKWSDSAVDEAVLGGWLWAGFGWQIHTRDGLNDRSLRNFPMQANGAEMLRIACILLTEAGIRVCAPVHDALLIEAPLDELDEAIVTAKSLMREASRIVLDGFELGSEVKTFRYPERYMDKRGVVMWNATKRLSSGFASSPRTASRSITVPVKGDVTGNRDTGAPLAASEVEMPSILSFSAAVWACTRAFSYSPCARWYSLPGMICSACNRSARSKAVFATRASDAACA